MKTNQTQLYKAEIIRGLNKLKLIVLFIILLPLFIMLDMIGMDVFSDD